MLAPDATARSPSSFAQPTCELVFHAIVVLYGESAAQVVCPPHPPISGWFAGTCGRYSLSDPDARPPSPVRPSPVTVRFSGAAAQVKHHLSLPPGQLQVHLTRDEADAARLMAGPQAFSGPEGIERSWGSLEELLDGTRLPPYPRTVLTRLATN